MGNAAWGNGYHQGLSEGRLQGGGIGVAAGSVVGALLLAGGRKVYEQIQKRRKTRPEEILMVGDESSVPEDRRNN